MIRSCLIILIKGYKLILSPILHALGGPGSGCRFQPTCSEYAIEALQKHGSLRGTWLALKRISRCHPWGGLGHDPVPPVPEKDGRSKTAVD